MPYTSQVKEGARRVAAGFQPHVQQQGFRKLYDYFVTGMTYKSPFPTICAYDIYFNVLYCYSIARKRKTGCLKGTNHKVERKKSQKFTIVAKL